MRKARIPEAGLLIGTLGFSSSRSADDLAVSSIYHLEKERVHDILPWLPAVLSWLPEVPNAPEFMEPR